jgi:hypothetical protein
MSCPLCVSDNQVEFSAEIVVHSSGLKNIDCPAVYVFPKLLVCVSCGFSQFTVPKAELAVLASDSPNSGRLTMAAAV